MNYCFGATLKTYRERRGISQAKLATAAGLDHTFVSRLESEQRIPSRDTVTKLCEQLDLGEFDTWNLMASAGFTNGHTEPPPLEDEIEKLLMLVRGALRDDHSSVADKRTLIRSIKLMLDGITFKEIC